MTQVAAESGLTTSSLRATRPATRRGTRTLDVPAAGLLAGPIGPRELNEVARGAAKAHAKTPDAQQIGTEIGDHLAGETLH